LPIGLNTDVMPVQQHWCFLSRCMDLTSPNGNSQSVFLTTISHELRTPLTSIMAFADLLTHNSTGNFLGKHEWHLQIIQRS
ncbi:MAG: histidine kinase dimerization/phospho-acceptor domain-containing protein, partial [Dehalococcoidia bacterium]